jgi:hypothetical protein
MRPGSVVCRRTLFQLASAAALSRIAAAAGPRGPKPESKIVLVTLGGIRREESFSPEGVVNIPHLYSDLLPQSVFYTQAWNEGVTSHFNTISSILTGVWQHVDDWGSQPPVHPTLFQYVQDQLGASPAETWVVTSNKALTANIGPGANVILSKQLLVESVERIIKGYSARSRLDRDMLLEELTAVMQDDYERIGWNVASPSAILNPEMKQTFMAALVNFIHGPDGPTSGDELTCFVAQEVLRRISPSLLVVNFSDMEVAHSGTYSLYQAGIRKADRLVQRLWQSLQSLREYRDRATMVIMSEFGRDPDGSTTNGFFNHRSNTESNRCTWMMVLGRAVRQPAIVEHPVRQIDVAPSLGALLGVTCRQATGSPLGELAV